MPGGTGFVGFVGLRCRVAQSEARVSSDIDFPFLLSTPTTVAVAVIFGLCIIVNGIPAYHKICKMFRCMCRCGVCVSFAVVMRSFMCSSQCVFLVRQCNVHSLMSSVMCVFALSVVCGMGGPGFTYRPEDPLS